MESTQRVRETVTGMVFLLLLAGSFFAFEARAQTSDPGAGVSAMQQAPDAGAAVPQASGPIYRRPSRQARRSARSEHRARQQEASRQEAPAIVEQKGPQQEAAAEPGASRAVPPTVEQKVSRNEAVPAAAALADIIISLGPDPRHAQGSQTGNPPGSQSRYSAVHEGEVAVEARVEGRDAKGLPVAISAAWNPADPATVDVSPAQGSAVKITVRGTGQSNLTVSGPGFAKDLWISAIADQGKAIQVQISQ